MTAHPDEQRKTNRTVAELLRQIVVLTQAPRPFLAVTFLDCERCRKDRSFRVRAKQSGLATSSIRTEQSATLEPN
jgi:hypothetical protein